MVPLPIALLLARLLSALSRLLRQGEGATLSGKVLLRLRPHAIRELTRGRRVILVSGTNGKTSTSAMLVSMLQERFHVGGNRTGANLDTGIAASLVSSKQCDLFVFEVDELYLPSMIKETSPEIVLLLNLSRDQLHRTQEVRIVARKWHEALAAFPDTQVVVDSSDPFLASVVRDHVPVTRIAFGKRTHIDAASCPTCGAMLDWRGTQFHCSSCGLGNVAPDHEFGGMTAVARNHALAEHIARKFGVQDFSKTPPRDRISTLFLGGIEIDLRLVKNPSSWQEGLSSLSDEPVILAVNARGVDGLDTSWLWDVDFTPLKGRYVVVTGERRLDAAYRIHVDGVGYSITESLAAAAAQIQKDGFNRSQALTSYTAFIDATTRVKSARR